MAKSLQEITDTWANWMNGRYSGGGIRFTASTRYSNNSELDAYHQYQTNPSDQTITFDPNAPDPTPGQAFSQATNYENDTSLQQTVTYTQSMQTSKSFTWSVTELLSIGLEVSITAGTPAVAQIGAKVTTNLTLSSTQGASESEQQTWTVANPYNVAPHTSLQATLVVTTQQYNVNWGATVTLRGCVAIWFNNKIELWPGSGYHWLWFIPVQSVIADCQANNLIDTTGYTVIGDGIFAKSSGVFTGGQGLSTSVKVKESPLHPEAASLDERGSTGEYLIPLNDAGNNAYVSTLEGE